MLMALAQSGHGNPQCQYMQIFPRANINEAWKYDQLEHIIDVDEQAIISPFAVHPEHGIGGMVSVPRVLSFSHTDELEIKSVYSDMNEVKFSHQVKEALSAVPHEVQFTTIEHDSEHVVVAHLKLSKPKTVEDMEPVLIKLREGCFVHFQLYAEGLDKEQKITAFTMVQGAGFVPGALSFIVIGTPLRRFKENNLSRTTSEPSKWMKTKVTIREDTAALRRQISGVHAFATNPWAKPFHDAVLNRYPASLPKTNPLPAVKKLTKDEIDEIIQDVLGLVPFNQEQAEAITKACADHRGGFDLIAGLPGAGKTNVICAITAIFLSVGIRVLLAASTNAAADHLTNKLIELLHHISNDPKLNAIHPIRVYRSMEESKNIQRFDEDGEDANSIDLGENASDVATEADEGDKASAGLETEAEKDKKFGSTGYI